MRPHITYVLRRHLCDDDDGPQHNGRDEDGSPYESAAGGVTGSGEKPSNRWPRTDALIVDGNFSGILSQSLRLHFLVC